MEHRTAKSSYENAQPQQAGYGHPRHATAEFGTDIGVFRERRSRRRVAYLVLLNAAEPLLLARVRWPDVYQAISAVRPDWQADPGLFDLPYSTASTVVTHNRAAEIAKGWGARLPSDDEAQPSGPSLIRRMPSDWSNLSTAERRAWCIETPTRRRRWGRRVGPVPSAVIDLTDATMAARKTADRT